MNYLQITIMTSFALLCSSMAFSAYMMDSGRMNSEEGYQDSYSENNYDRLQAQNDRPSYGPPELDSEPVPQEERFYRFGGHRPAVSPDPNQPKQFGQDTYPYTPTDYDNKNRRWLTADK